MNNIIKYLVFSFIIGFNAVYANGQKPVDLTVVSSIDFNGSVRRHAIGLIDSLKDDLSINFIPSRPVDLTEVDPAVQKIILKEVKTPGHVALLEDPLWYADAVPNSKIKIAFSVCESTRIPNEWVHVLNHQFDAVVVADPFYIKVYEESGVNIPVFHIPLGIFIDEFLDKPIKSKANTPFVFRCNARFFNRKNHQLIVKAFAKEFGNRRDIILKMNGGGKWGKQTVYDKLKQLVKGLKINNIFVTNDPLPWKDYVEQMSKMDCYINVSVGEGFSIQPREALALGIPVIVSNNTAQKTLCASGFVRAVTSKILITKYSKKADQELGYQFNCKQEDVQKAMRDVYENYEKYLDKAHEGRNWVKQYRWESLKNKYINLVKPMDLRLGDKNEVTDAYLMTTSQELYDKYVTILAN